MLVAPPLTGAGWARRLACFPLHFIEKHEENSPNRLTVPNGTDTISTADRRPQTADRRPQTADRRPGPVVSASTGCQRRPPLDSTSRHRSSRRAPALAWLVLPLLAALLATSAVAQTPQLLVGSNASTGSDLPASITFGANNDVGIVFRTGAHPTGYSVANVRIRFMGTPSATDLSRLTVTIRNVASANPGGTVIGTFTDPATGSLGDNTFTAPAGGIKLEPSTNYALMLDVPQNQGLAVPLSVRTGETRGDEQANTFGWTIRNNLRRRVSNRWESAERVPFFQISGSENPPDAPAGLTATAGDAQVTLTWTDPSNSAIDKYQLRQGTGTTVSWGSWTDITSSSATTTSHTVTGLTNGTQYSFQVRAVDGTVDGTASATVTATPAALAQTQVLVSNTGEATAAGWRGPRAIKFTTGDNSAGYTVSSVSLENK